MRKRKNEEREMYDDRIFGNGSFVENVDALKLLYMRRF